MKLEALLFAMGVATAGNACGAPGDLDPAFGSNGLVRIEDQVFDDPASDRAATVFAQADGRLLVGSENQGQTDFAVVRLNVDGALDSGFGVGGRTHLDAPDLTGRTAVVMQQNDGNVIVGGTASTDSDLAQYGGWATSALAVARFFGDGRADPSFGTGGVALVDFSGLQNASAIANAVVQQSGGKLVVAGTVGYMGWWDYGDFGDNDMVLVRFDSAGVVDTSFGTTGRVALDPSGGSGSGILWLTQQPDGKLVAAGYIGPDMAVLRLTADGALDPSFGGDGIVILPAGVPDVTSSAGAVAVQADGRIVVGGTVQSQCDGDDPACENGADAIVVRLNADGSLDATFGSGGRVTLDAVGTSTEVSAAGIMIEPSGAIIVGGSTALAGGPRYGFLTRFTSTGVPDTTFGASGTTLIDLGRDVQPSNAQIGGIARFANGDIGAALSAWEVDGPNGIVFSSLVVARAAHSSGGPGVLGLEQPQITADEGSDATFVVRRSGGSVGQVSVDFATQYFSGGAAAADFKASPGTLTWADGDSAPQMIRIPVAADGIVEPAEGFSITLSNLAGGAVLAAWSGDVAITDVNANAGVLQFDVDSASTPNGGFLNVTVTRTAGQTGMIAVHYASIGGTAIEDMDFEAQNGALVWGNGDAASKTIRIPITYGGGDDDATESFRLILSAPSGGATLGANTTLTATIHGAPPAVVNGSASGGGAFTGDLNGGKGFTTGSGGGGSTSVLDVVLLGLVLGWSMARRVRQIAPPQVARQSKVN